MPGYKTHLAGGVCIFILSYYLLVKCNGPQAPLGMPLLLGATLFGSLFPDLDINSKIQRLFYLCIIAAFLVFLLTHQWFNLLITAGLAILIGILRHRTILHHPVFLTLLPLPIIYYMSNNNYSLTTTLLPAGFFIAGAWSHILLDFGFKNLFKKH